MFQHNESVHRIHYIISKDFATEPIDDSDHKYTMTSYLRASDVCTPYLIRTFYLAFTQKIRKFPTGFCNKNLNEEPEVASTDDSRLNPDSDHLFELFWIQAAGQGHTS